MNEKYNTEEYISGKFIAAGIAIVLVIILAFTSMKVIPTGYTGVKTTFGQVSSKVVSPGFTFKIPIAQKIQKVNNKQQDAPFDDKIWAETSSRTALYFEGVTVTYQIAAEKSSWLVANVTNYKDNILTSAVVASAIKTASKELSDTDVTNRGKIEPLAQEKLQTILDGKYGEGTVAINRITISNIDFEDEYNAAIAEKQKAQLNYEKAIIENKQNVENAKATADAKAKLAEGEANAIKIKAEAEAKANELISKSLNDNILNDRLIDKWDGQLPSVAGSTASILPSDFFSKNKK